MFSTVDDIQYCGEFSVLLGISLVLFGKLVILKVLALLPSTVLNVFHSIKHPPFNTELPAKYFTDVP